MAMELLGYTKEISGHLFIIIIILFAQ